MGRKKKIVADSSLYYIDIDKHGNKVLKKKGFFRRLFDSKDTTVAASTVFMIALMTVGIILLLIPAVALMIEVCYNHTITTDLNGMGVYIGAVSTLILQGGLLKGWTNYSTYKYLGNKGQELNTQLEEIEADITPDMEDQLEPEIDM